MTSNMVRHNERIGFTILEVLIALTASLLLMLGLTRAFKLIGDRITTSQSELELSSELRDVTFRLRDEMRRLTPAFEAPLKPGKGGGYFYYYEGPWTDATTTLVHGTTTNSDVSSYHPTSRIGDIDDFIGFTTRSDRDKPFAGFVPAGVLEAVRLEKHLDSGGTVASFRTLGNKTIGGADPFTRDDANLSVVIYSELAEVCYFACPEWNRSALGIPVIADPTATPPSSTPEFRDVINETGTATAGDGVPDRISLRRRILLIRPDLNLSLRRINFLNSAIGTSPSITPPEFDIEAGQLPFFDGSAILPLGQVPQFNPGPWDAAISTNSPNWLTGMARVYQWMDLSVSRFIRNTSNTTIDQGIPLPDLRANSLDDLSSPENRFAAVRMPIGLMNANSLAPFTSVPLPLPTGGSRLTSSMPLLALSPPHPLIASNTGQGFDNSPNPSYSAMGGQAATSSPTHQFALVGFLRPEFSLADHWFDFGTTTARPTLRGGSDIVAQDLLAFDVQVYDPNAVVAIWTGPDGQPGVAGVNDDGDVDGVGSPLVDNTNELGFADSDDVLVDVSSKAMRSALNFAVMPLPTPSSTMPSGISFVTIPYGGYVDHGYVRLAGGSIGGNASGGTPPLTTRIPPSMLSSLTTPYSGLRTATNRNSFPVEWQDSGKFVLSSGPVPSFYQASIDTWTSTYDTDDFEQNTVRWPTTAFTGSTLVFEGSQGSVGTELGSANSRYWSVVRTAISANRENRFGPTPVSSSNFTEATPPAPLPTAIKITIRVYDRVAGEIRQQSIIEHFD